MISESASIAKVSQIRFSISLTYFHQPPLQHNMLQKSNKAQVQLALQAMQNDIKLSLRAVARIYSVDH